MFLPIPVKLHDGRDFQGIPVVNGILIVLNVLTFWLGWHPSVGPGSGVFSVITYAFGHADVWHLSANMIALLVFGTPVNRRIGNGWYFLVYFGTALSIGLFVRLFVWGHLLGASGAIFSVIAIAVILMPSSTIDVAYFALFPATLIVGFIQPPAHWAFWFIRWDMFSIRAWWGADSRTTSRSLGIVLQWIELDQSGASVRARLRCGRCALVATADHDESTLVGCITFGRAVSCFSNAGLFRLHVSLKVQVMGLFKRISDIISANLNDMTEGFEDPEMMLKQAIREMEQSIADATQETAKVLANEKQLAKELHNNELQAQDWQRKAEKSVEAGDDALARKALSRKQEHQKLVIALQDQLTLAKESSQALKHQLEGMQAKMAEAKRNLATLSARKKAADFKKKMATSSSLVEAGSAADNAFAKFDRLREKVERAEAEAEALSELNTSSLSSMPDEPQFSTRSENEVDDELQALKKKLMK